MSAEDDDLGDSIRALEKVARSQRIRGFIVTAWPYIAPILYVAGGWLGRGLAIADQLEKNTAATAANVAGLAELKTAVEGNRIREEQNLFAIGRYAAYAAAGFQAYESAKLKDQKRAYAEKYALAYERLVRGGRTPDEAYAALYESVSLP